MTKFPESKAAHTINNTDEAAARAIAADQIWGGEGYTIYLFDDNSLWATSGSASIAIDADNAESVQNYLTFLGADAHLDAERIKNMNDALLTQGD